jgi:hypothetical protein
MLVASSAHPHRLIDDEQGYQFFYGISFNSSLE